MDYRLIKANIVKHVAKNGGVLIHQVNCQQIAGAGIAEQIRYQWPAWFEHYKNRFPTLGNVDVFDITYPALPKVTIVSLYAQQLASTRSPQTDYEAFSVALVRLRYYIARTGETAQDWATNHGGIYVPMGIGCGLGGGTWAIIKPILTEYMPADFTLCKLPA